MNPTHLTCAETAKLVRSALARAFGRSHPEVRFRVRSQTYTLGGSLHISWEDGPTTRMVDDAVASYAGASFDGSIDMQVTKYHWLMPDGTSTLAHNPGTLGSGGQLPSEHHWMPGAGATLVAFGADYINTSRSLTPAFATAILEHLRAKFGPEPFAGLSAKRGYLLDDDGFSPSSRLLPNGQYLTDIFNTEAAMLTPADLAQTLPLAA